jgi:hypothetical protein
MAHDPAVDLAGILAYHDVEIDVTDPRAVQDLLASNLTLRVKVADAMPSDLFWDVRDSVMSLPEISPSEPWGNAERILSKFTNDRIAKAIISGVGRLANLIKAEKVLELRKPDDLKSVAAGPTKPGLKRQPGSPGGNDFSI